MGRVGRTVTKALPFLLSGGCRGSHISLLSEGSVFILETFGSNRMYELWNQSLGRSSVTFLHS